MPARSILVYPDIDVLVVTAYPESGDVAKAMRHGAVDVLVKPLDMGLVRDIVTEIAEAGRRRRRQASPPHYGSDWPRPANAGRL